MEDLKKYIGEPLLAAKIDLEKQGFSVVVKKNSLPKIKTDFELVVFAKQLNEKEVELIVGDFLINIENKIS